MTGKPLLIDYIKNYIRNVDRDSSKWTVIGIDWARCSDYTAMVAMQDGAVIDIERLRNLPWHIQIDRAVEFIRRTGGNAVLADKTFVRDAMIDQLRERMYQEKMEVRVDGLVSNAQNKCNLLKNLATAFLRNKISIPDDRELINELSLLEYELLDSGKLQIRVVSGCHDDLVIALALAWRMSQWRSK